MNELKDWQFVQAASEELEAYLASQELFWPLSARGAAGDLPRLTLGGLLLALKKILSASAAADRVEAQRLEAKIADILHRHRALTEKKAAREFRSRLRQWSNYLREYEHEPENYADAYPYEVRWRVILSLLYPYLAQEIHVRAAVEALDALLKDFFLPGDFLWEMAWQAAFPRDEFWYLYGRLKS